MDELKAERQAQQGKNLKRLISNENIDQNEFAKRIGVSVATVSKWATGRTAISKKRIDKITEVFPGYTKEFIAGKTACYSPYDNFFEREYKKLLREYCELEHYCEKLEQGI